MAMLDELEAALRAKWDRDTLAVYADHLQSLGELRGELIVIDLRIEEAGPLPELLERRKELLAQWLATLPPGKVQHGFLDVDATGAQPYDQICAAFASPAAPYIRTIAIVGPPDPIRRAIEHVSAAKRVGLARIVLRQWDAAAAPTLDARQTAALFDATPDLDTLELDGYRLCGDVSHRTLRRIRISGGDAIEGLLDRKAAPWPALEEIDFAFASHVGGRRDSLPFDVLPPRNFPKLRVLDLSRNEQGWFDPDNLGATVNVFEVLSKRSFPTLRLLRLPMIKGNSIPLVNAALRAMPALEEIAIRGTSKRIEHPSARITFF